MADSTFHDFTLAHQTVSCWPSEWVSAGSSGWYSIQCIHSFSTGWAIQRITRFYLPWEMTTICHYLGASNETSYTQNSTGPSCLDCDTFSIYVTTVSKISYIQNNLRRNAVCRLTHHRNSVTRSQADTIWKTMYYFWNLYPVYGVCSYYSPGQMYSPCLCFDVELGKNKWHK